MTDTLLVSLFGGPGTGKSTTAALVFGTLKQRGYNVELVHEFAKDLTWEERSGALAFQPYVAAKQMWWNERLRGKVDAIITDTSPLLSLVYSNPSDEFKAWLVAEEKKWDRYDVFLRRNPGRPYIESGRSQSPQEASDLDVEIARVLTDVRVSGSIGFLKVDKDKSSHVKIICERIEEKLVKQR